MSDFIHIDGYSAHMAELGYKDEEGKWVPNGAVRHMAGQIEALRQRVAELEPFKSAYLEQVELHNKTLDELAACEKERDELKAACDSVCYARDQAYVRIEELRSARPVCIGCCKAIDGAMK